MPRQPFLPTFAHLDYVVGALVLNDRPELSAAIGRCIAIWSQADNEMGNLFGILLGTDSAAALEVFLTLRRSASQRDALDAAAKFKLVGQELAFFKTLARLYGSLEKERNALAHGCFGVATNDDFVLLWIDICHHVHFQTEALTSAASGVFPPDAHQRLKQHMFVYRKDDLSVLQGNMEEFWRAALHFNSYLRFSARDPKTKQFQDLLSIPIIKTASGS